MISDEKYYDSMMKLSLLDQCENFVSLLSLFSSNVPLVTHVISGQASYYIHMQSN